MTSITGNIFNIKRYAIHDGPNIRTTVFFKGCSLSCWWCHNPEGKSPEVRFKSNPRQTFESSDEKLVPLGGWTSTVSEIMGEIRKDLPFFQESGGGVTFSGGDPLYQPEFLQALLKACGQENIHRSVDTSAHAPAEIIRSVAGETELWLLDLKHMDNTLHLKHTGLENGLILQNIKLLDALGAEIRIRIPLIPGVNADEQNLTASAKFICDLERKHPIDILPYHDTAASKYRTLGLDYRQVQASGPESLNPEQLIELMGSYGLSAQIGG
ncbi:MAG: glycyl-radical enzyme activating protein [Candidatus Marinimicrobia bacterium]|nr:glycyl-radical enzyme activating protein [Candidatus Neomarinimicrobiota bacterium]MCF7850276.1 glycyl-radical enzyme activating protein [Candidatus Neomarinimicrobiota bacterium]MCF7903827.1 glycyl-radical enzyme activating protein [Candidatus Neomarinimicrobiota bacterium]